MDEGRWIMEAGKDKRWDVESYGRSEIRNQRSEGKRQMSEGRGQKTDDGPQEIEVGGQEGRRGTRVIVGVHRFRSSRFKGFGHQNSPLLLWLQPRWVGDKVIQP